MSNRRFTAGPAARAGRLPGRDTPARAARRLRARAARPATGPAETRSRRPLSRAALDALFGHGPMATSSRPPSPAPPAPRPRLLTEMRPRRTL